MAINYLSKDGAKWLMTKIKGLLNGKVDKVAGKGLSTNDFTTAEKNKLAGIATEANKYTLPAATADTLGGVKTGANITNTDGAISLTKKNVTDALGYTPPEKDTNTWTALKGATASVAGTAGYAPAPAAGDQGKYLKGDGTWGTPTNTTYSDATQSAHGLMTAADKKKLDGIADGANKYTLPTAGNTLGGVKTTSTVTDTTGYTAAPIIGGVPYYKDTNTTYNAATQSENGLMSAADKKKLDAFDAASAYATQAYVGQQIAAAGHLIRQIVNALPEVSAAKDNVIYMVKKSSGKTGDLYDEYMLIAGAMEHIGSTDVDLAPYAKTADFVALNDSDLEAMWAEA